MNVHHDVMRQIGQSLADEIDRNRNQRHNQRVRIANCDCGCIELMRHVRKQFLESVAAMDSFIELRKCPNKVFANRGKHPTKVSCGTKRYGQTWYCTDCKKEEHERTV